MGAAVIRVPVPARGEDPCRIHRKVTPVTRGWGPHLSPAPVGRQGHEGLRVRVKLSRSGARAGRAGLRGGVGGGGVSTLTGSCARTWGSGTRPRPTSCHGALAHSAFGISCTATPVGVEKGAGLLSEENPGSPILATVGIFTPWKLVNATNLGSFPGLRFKSWS